MAQTRSVLALDVDRHYLRQTIAVLDRLDGAAWQPDAEERWRRERERMAAVLGGISLTPS